MFIQIFISIDNHTLKKLRYIFKFAQKQHFYEIVLKKFAPENKSLTQ